MKIRVYYEDTDIGGVVYHSKYFNYCERVRSEAFFEKGLSPVLKTGHFVTRKINADFFTSATLGDLLEVKTRLGVMKSASFTLIQTIYKGDEKIFEMEVLLVYINFDAKAQKMTQEIKDLILSLFEK